MDRPLSAKRKRYDEDFRGDGRYDRRDDGYRGRPRDRDRRGDRQYDRGRNRGKDRYDGGRRDRHSGGKGGGKGWNRNRGKGGMPPRRHAPKKATKTKHQIVTCVEGVLRTQSCSENDQAYIIQQLLVKVGDPSNEGKPLTPQDFTNQLAEHLPGLAGAMDEDIEKNPEELACSVLTCASHVPLKVSLYATFSGLVNVEHESFGLLLLQKASSELQHALQNLSAPKATFRARLLLQYIGGMANAHALDPESFVRFLEKLISDAAEAHSNARSDVLVYLALTCLPWVGQTLQEKCGDALDRFLTSAGAYVQNRRPYLTLSLLAEAGEETAENSPTNELNIWWTNVSQMSTDREWKSPAIYCGWEICAEDIAEGTLHQMPEVTWTPASSGSASPGAGRDEAEALAMPSPRINICTREAGEKVSPGCAEEAAKVEILGNATKMLIHHHVRDILFAFVPDHKEAAEQLTNWMGVIDVDASKELLILESFFSMLLAQPVLETGVPRAYMYAVLINLARAHKQYAKHIAQTVLMLYNTLDLMAEGAIDALSSWLAHFMSNYEYAWPWNKFTDVCSVEGDELKPEDSRRRLFVKAVLEKAVRLSYLSRVGGVLKDKEPFKPLLQLLPQNEPKTYSKYLNYEPKEGGDDTPPEGVELCKTIAAKIEEKVSDEDMLAYLHEQMPADQTTIEFRVEVWMHALLTAEERPGASSYSHLLDLIASYKTVMVTLKKADGEEAMLTSLQEVWQNSTQAQFVVVDKFLGMRLVTPVAVIRWVFSSDNTKRFEGFAPWEFLHLAIDWGLKRIDTLEVAEAAKKEAAAEDATGDQGAMADEEESAALTQKKELFLIVFQRMCMVMQEYAQEHGEDQWYAATSRRFLQAGAKYASHLRPIINDIEQQLPDLDVSIKTVLEKVKRM